MMEDTMRWRIDPDEKMLSDLKWIDRHIEEANAAFAAIPNIEEEQLRFLVDFAANSAAFEGLMFSYEEVNRLYRGYDLNGISIEARTQMTGYKDAYYYMLELHRANESLSEEMIKKIHYICTPMGDDIRGAYRKEQIQVSLRKCLPCEADVIPEQMKKLMSDYYQCPLHPVLKAAWFQLQHEAVHPLHFANGRTERILINFILLQEGMLPICIRFTDKAYYLSCFDIYYETGNIRPMAQYFIQLEIESIKSCIEKGKAARERSIYAVR